jgi:hypothetical protein
VRRLHCPGACRIQFDTAEFSRIVGDASLRQYGKLKNKRFKVTLITGHLFFAVNSDRKRQTGNTVPFCEISRIPENQPTVWQTVLKRIKSNGDRSFTA